MTINNYGAGAEIETNTYQDLSGSNIKILNATLELNMDVGAAIGSDSSNAGVGDIDIENSTITRRNKFFDRFRV